MNIYEDLCKMSWNQKINASVPLSFAVYRSTTQIRCCESQIHKVNVILGRKSNRKKIQFRKVSIQNVQQFRWMLAMSKRNTRLKVHPFC